MTQGPNTRLRRRLADPPYAKFPFQIGADGAVTSSRSEHIREQIEQVLFTDPQERVFRAEFGAGVRTLLFEPNGTALWEITKKRVTASLAEVLEGEVDPKTLDIKIAADEDNPERLLIVISYALAAIGVNENHTFNVGTGGP